MYIFKSNYLFFYYFILLGFFFVFWVLFLFFFCFFFCFWQWFLYYRCTIAEIILNYRKKLGLASCLLKGTVLTDNIEKTIIHVLGFHSTLFGYKKNNFGFIWVTFLWTTIEKKRVPPPHPFSKYKVVRILGITNVT